MCTGHYIKISIYNYKLERKAYLIKIEEDISVDRNINIYKLD